MGVYTVHLAGESYRNSDGTPRQRIIRRLSSGDPLRLVREPDNRHDPDAVAVHARGGQVGYVARDQCGWVAEIIDAGRPISASVLSRAAPADRPDVFGVLMEVRTAADARLSPPLLAPSRLDQKSSVPWPIIGVLALVAAVAAALAIAR